MRSLLKRKKTIILLFVAIVLLSSFCVHVFLVNREHRKMEIYNEVTFMGPNQAIIFWKSKENTLGYIKYGESKFKRKNVSTQTSSEKGEVHAVFLEKIPLEGFYVSIHNESDSFLIFPNVFKVEYTGEDLFYE